MSRFGVLEFWSCRVSGVSIHARVSCILYLSRINQVQNLLILCKQVNRCAAVYISAITEVDQVPRQCRLLGYLLITGVQLFAG
jgi:hypothetical protein